MGHRKSWVLVGILSLWLCGTAEASWFSNSLSYLWSPVNCVWNAGVELVTVGKDFVVCILANMNRNPATLDPVLPNPVPRVEPVAEPVPTPQ